MPPRRDTVVQHETEDLSEARAAAIVEAVVAKGKYELRRDHNPLPDEVLSFNFSNCSGSLEDIVLALVSIEKVFRMIPDPNATVSDQVKVDVRVDEFLKLHFEQYRVYCAHQAENPEEREPKPEQARKRPGLFSRIFAGKERRAKERLDAAPPPDGERSRPKAPHMYLMYTHMKEDEQYDDITVLALKRK